MTTSYRPALRKLLSPERILRSARPGAVACRPRATSCAMRTVARHPSRPRQGKGRASGTTGARAAMPSEPNAPDHQEVRVVGRGAARVAVPDPRGEGRAILGGRYGRVHGRRSRPLAMPVLVHRVLANFHAEADGLTRADAGGPAHRAQRETTWPVGPRRGTDKLASTPPMPPEASRSSDEKRGTPLVLDPLDLARLSSLAVRARVIVEGACRGHAPRNPHAAHRSSSPNTRNTRRATTCATSTGRRSGARSTTTTSSASRTRTEMRTASCSSTRRRR